MKKVLILTAGFGDGHNAAARNVRETLELTSPEVEVTVADLYERSYKKLNSIAKKAYLGAIGGAKFGFPAASGCAPELVSVGL